MTAAGIDIGTNTILMVIGRREDDGTLTILEDVQRIPRLGQGEDDSGVISQGAIDRAAEGSQRLP